MAAITLTISSPRGEIIYPPVAEGVQLSSSRRGSPAVLKFTVLKDQAMADLGGFAEGALAQLFADGKPLFQGYIFSKRRDKEGAIECTAYDQIRYLKNKDVLRYKNMPASEVVKLIAADNNLQIGEIAPTGYIIPWRSEFNVTLLDLTNKGQMFLLYDNCGRLTLKNIAQMRVDILINAAAAENFDYTSSIDEQTYNQIKLASEDRQKKYEATDEEHIKLWGKLQYFDTLKEGENGQAKADALLKLYNSKTRRLKINRALGDVRVRAGCLVGVALDLGDIVANTLMLVEKVTHTFKESEHLMDLTLRGGEFIA